MNKIVKTFFTLIILCYLSVSYAVTTASISFFASNNTVIINPLQAYERMLNEAQDELKNTMIAIMQSNHMEQNKCEDSIGMYQMENDHNLTSDNTKIFTTSPYQMISDTKAFAMAEQMANTLKQESVAVFIPDKRENIGDIVVHLKSHPYHLAETLKIINEKLPQEYSRAFSLHFGNKLGGFEGATISSIEWLGHKVDFSVIQRIFPQEEISFKQGKAFLVFKNGQKNEI